MADTMRRRRAHRCASSERIGAVRRGKKQVSTGASRGSVGSTTDCRSRPVQGACSPMARCGKTRQAVETSLSFPFLTAQSTCMLIRSKACPVRWLCPDEESPCVTSSLCTTGSPQHRPPRRRSTANPSSRRAVPHVVVSGGDGGAPADGCPSLVHQRRLVLGPNQRMTHQQHVSPEWAREGRVTPILRSMPRTTQREATVPVTHVANCPGSNRPLSPGAWHSVDVRI